MRTTIYCALVLSLLPLAASAQTFPPDSAYLPMRCRNGIMTDPYRDVINAIDDLDTVGGGADPAGLAAADNQFLYLRLRLDGDPRMGTGLLNSAWGFAFDTDGNLQTYEILVSASGLNNQVSVYRNSATTIADSPADLADTPPVAAFPFATHGRVSVATGSNFGNNPDFFITLAVPWTTLQPLGFGPSTSVRVWAGTSSVADALDLDLACHDGAAGSPNLSSTASDPTRFGSTGGSGGAGGSGGVVGPVGSDNGLEFEGGPACSCRTAAGSDPAGAWLLLLIAIVVLRKRR